MNPLTDLFETMAELSGYAPGADSSLSLDDLQPAARTAVAKVKSLISPDVYRVVIEMREPLTLDAIRTAVASQTLQQQLVFDTVNRRKAEINLYKYEVEALRRSYAENYFAAMDHFFELMFDPPEELLRYENAAVGEAGSYIPKEFFRSRQAQLRDQCPIRSTAGFDTLYPIDMSHLFYFRTLPLQREVYVGKLRAYYDNPLLTDELLQLLDLALAKKVVAMALRRFDILEFPPTIRNLFDDTTASRSGSDEAARAMQLAAALEGEVDEQLSVIDMMLDDDTTDYTSYSASNQPDDVIVMAP